MSGGKETPRQKMIGMMYLVLTALLALNVSKDILNAFVIVDESLTEANINLSKKSGALYTDLEKAYATNPAKTKPYWEKAQEVKKLSKELRDYIHDLRTRLVSVMEKKDKKVADTLTLEYIQGKDAYDETTRVMIGTDEVSGKGAEGEKLKQKIEEFQKKLLSIVTKEQAKRLGTLGFDLEDKYNPHFSRKAAWQMNTFYHTIQAAAVTIFNQLTLQVNNAEAEVVGMLKENISADDFKFDKITAKVIAKSNYVLTGDSYDADIFVAAYSTTESPEVLLMEGIDTSNIDFATKYPNAKKIGGADAATVSNGVVKYKAPASSEGLKKYAGVINVRKPNGEIAAYPFNSEYMVARPAAVVSADAMNVFYVGLDNPLSVSVPGIASENVMVSMSAGGTATKVSNGKFKVRVSPGKTVEVRVSAKFGAQTKNMGTMTYRIKKVPDPRPAIAGKSQGSVSKSLLVASPFVQALLDDFLFDNVKYRITSFKISVTKGGGFVDEFKCPGENISDQGINALKKSTSGAKVYFEEIKAVGPDGTERTLSNMIFKLN